MNCDGKAEICSKDEDSHPYWSEPLTTYGPRHEISNNVVSMTSKASDQPAHMHSLIRAFDGRLNIL